MEKIVSIYREISTNNLYGSKEQAEKRIMHAIDDEYCHYLNDYLSDHFILSSLFFITEEEKQAAIRDVIEKILKEEFEMQKISIEI